MPEASTVLLLSKHTNSPCLNTPELHFTLHFFSESEREREIVRGNISKHTLPDAHMLNPVSLQTTHMDMILQCSFSTFQTQRHTYFKKKPIILLLSACVPRDGKRIRSFSCDCHRHLVKDFNREETFGLFIAIYPFPSSLLGTWSRVETVVWPWKHSVILLSTSSPPNFPDFGSLVVTG